jgi:hypothetical protein
LEYPPPLQISYLIEIANTATDNNNANDVRRLTKIGGAEASNFAKTDRKSNGCSKSKENRLNRDADEKVNEN